MIDDKRLRTPMVKALRAVLAPAIGATHASAQTLGYAPSANLFTTEDGSLVGPPRSGMTEPGGAPASVVPERFRFLYALNPIVGIIDGFRRCLLGAQNSIYWPGLEATVIEVILLIVSGVWYFRKTEQTFADVI